MSVVEFMLSSFPSLLFEGWSFIEGSVDARLFFGRLMVATTAAAPRITLRRDKQLDSSSEAGDILDSASFLRVGVFIAISSVAQLGFQEPQRFGPVKLLCLVTQLDSTARPLSDDQPSTALTTQIGPHPLQKDAEPQAGLGQELNVDESPHEPGYKAAELNSGALQHCEILPHNGKIALIE
jgi:hypothetical protein